jgi:hypothetical protein
MLQQQEFVDVVTAAKVASLQQEIIRLSKGKEDQVTHGLSSRLLDKTD